MWCFIRSYWKFLEWLRVKTGVPQRSILGPLFFLIYINDLIDLISTVKLFAYDTSLFSIIHDAKTTGYELNKDLRKNSWMGALVENVI